MFAKSAPLCEVGLCWLTEFVKLVLFALRKLRVCDFSVQKLVGDSVALHKLLGMHFDLQGCGGWYFLVVANLGGEGLPPPHPHQGHHHPEQQASKVVVCPLW